MAGGVDVNANQLTNAELYNPATCKWTIAGSLSEARVYFTATLLASGEVLIAGGSSPTACVATAELYNPSTGEWTSTGSMTQPLCSHSAAVLPNGEVLVAGGNVRETVGTDTLAIAELYNPSTS